METSRFPIHLRPKSLSFGTFPLRARLALHDALSPRLDFARAMSSTSPQPESLCLQCGICCDGTLFDAVELRPGDNSSELKSLGLPIRKVGTQARFQQPCGALNGCRCEIYPNRPTYCRKFRCPLLLKLTEGRILFRTALRLVRATRRKAARVGASMDELGEDDKRAALRKRFRKLCDRFATHPPARDDANRFAELSQDMHALNLVLSRRFYTDTP